MTLWLHWAGMRTRFSARLDLLPTVAPPSSALAAASLSTKPSSYRPSRLGCCWTRVYSEATFTVLRLRPARLAPSCTHPSKTPAVSSQQTRRCRYPRIALRSSPLSRPVQTGSAWNECTEQAGEHWHTDAQPTAFTRRIAEQPPRTSAQPYPAVERCERRYSGSERDGQHGRAQERRLWLRCHRGGRIRLRREDAAAEPGVKGAV